MREDFKELLKQTTQIQAEMRKAQSALNKQTVVGVAAAGQVKVKLSGRYDAKSVHIDESLMSGDREVLQDLIAGAINDAVRRVEELNEATLSGVASELPIKPGQWPF